MVLLGEVGMGVSQLEIDGWIDQLVCIYYDSTEDDYSFRKEFFEQEVEKIIKDIIHKAEWRSTT